MWGWGRREGLRLPGSQATGQHAPRSSRLSVWCSALRRGVPAAGGRMCRPATRCATGPGPCPPCSPKPNHYGHFVKTGICPQFHILCETVRKGAVGGPAALGRTRQRVLGDCASPDRRPTESLVYPTKCASVARAQPVPPARPRAGPAAMPQCPCRPLRIISASVSPMPAFEPRPRRGGRCRWLASP